MYAIFRNIHLLLASFSLPFLLMYAVSAVQMSHNTWFTMKPAVTEHEVSLTPGLTDARAVAREIMDRDSRVKGELTNIREASTGVALRLVVPGTVHDVQYERSTGRVRIKTSVAGFMGMLNRLHHAAGVRHELSSMNLWGVVVAIVSATLLLIGATGMYMWFTRRPERAIGLLLLGVNAAVVLGVLFAIRRAGP